ncbi:integrator complex subunit 12-like [Lutzomyia longipalpis]|uniref:Integrator complex subunit 12 n=2 Tax=Lutzomyia longipalpis TaxID=7200 RepID=A0A1B0CAG0_LUTLO|nr:integrator complex subunit 12-like [Lutzomyia longipalpis]XP_055678337.1 integrator complex subunit 12-like [Lutzomyia longipalpis]
MSTAAEMDPTIRNAIKLVHSSGSDSAEKIRQTLDELIKSRFSSSKMLVNVLSKKHLAEETTATGSGTATHPPHQRRHRSTDSNSKSSSSKSSSSNSSVSALEVATAIPIDTPIMVELETLDEDTIMEDDQLKELEELVCVVCRQVDVSFRNRLVECADCHSLYHQECHKPQISESDANDQENSWICVLCKSKEISKPAPAPIVTPPPPPIPSPPPHKSSSSSSSYKSSSKSHESSSKSKSKSTSSSSSKQSSRDSSSSSSKESSSRDKSSSSSSSSMTPKINIISADKRIQIMKKKAKLNEGKRKHK